MKRGEKDMKKLIILLMMLSLIFMSVALNVFAVITPANVGSTTNFLGDVGVPLSKGYYINDTLILATDSLTLTGTGTLNGLDAVDATGEDTIEALIFDADAGTITGNWVNTANPWADDEVSDTLTSSSCTGNAATVTGFTPASGSLTLAGADALTLTTTDTTGVTLPTSGTLYGTATGSITSLQLLTSVSDETGTGVLVFGTSPTFTTKVTTPLIIATTIQNGEIGAQNLKSMVASDTSPYDIYTITSRGPSGGWYGQTNFDLSYNNGSPFTAIFLRANSDNATARMSIGIDSPTARLHLPAGTATASTAPLKFTSGNLLTTAETGAIEFLTDKFYATITTSAVRKTLAYVEKPVVTLTKDDATPDVSAGEIFVTVANDAPCAITDLDLPSVGKIVTIICGSATNACTITDGGNFALSANWTPDINDVITLFVRTDNDYVEISRSAN